MGYAINRVKENIGRVLVGKDKTISLVLAAVLADGHVLLEDLPGTGKTMLAKSLAASVNGEFGRIQFTPDLLPSDVTGLSIYHQKENEFVFHPGPVFCNVLLADELNRATPRTQAGLLECMEERQITVDGVTRPLDNPFFVIATENPIETAGTFPLPEAELDRFLIRTSMGEVTAEEEMDIILRFMNNNPFDSLSPVCTIEELRLEKKNSQQVYIHRELLQYIQTICMETRNRNDIIMGASPRATLALLRIARAYAYMNDRSYVIPEDIRDLAVPVLAHRLRLQSGFGNPRANEEAVQAIVESVAVPTEDWKA